VTTRTIAKGAVTNAKLADGAVTATTVRKGTLTGTVFKKGALLNGLRGDVGAGGLKGDTGTQGPAGKDGSASVGLKARATGSVSAPNGGSTPVPLSAGTWTQSAGELDLITGSVTMTIPASCTGSFGNSLVLSVDGVPQTFAVAPTAPASKTVTVPVLVGTLSEPDADAMHTLTAALANSCTKSGENYTVSNAKLDVVKFR
jgi:hypothetical protein